jgi:hypothetical protein
MSSGPFNIEPARFQTKIVPGSLSREQQQAGVRTRDGGVVAFKRQNGEGQRGHFDDRSG